MLIAAIATLVLLGASPARGGCSFCPAGQEPTSADATERAYQTSTGVDLTGTCPRLACAVASEETDCSFYEANDLHAECCVEEEDICSLCVDGSEVQKAFEGVGSSYWRQTCGQLYHSAPFFARVAPMMCSYFRSVGHDECGCPSPPPLGDCDLCAGGEVPDPDARVDGHGRYTCGMLDVLSRVAAHRDPVDGCDAFRSLYGPGCCANATDPTSPAQTCGFSCPGSTDFFPFQRPSAFASAPVNFTDCLGLYTGLQADGNACKFYKDSVANSCCFHSVGSSAGCSLCAGGGRLNKTASAEINGTITNCSDIEAISHATDTSEECDALRTEDIVAACCLEPLCELCPYRFTEFRWWQTVEYGGESGTTCGAVNETLHNGLVVVGSSVCDDARSKLSDECCSRSPMNACGLCPSYTSTDKEVVFDGSAITCGGVNEILAAEEDDSCFCLDTQNSLLGECCFETPCGFCVGSSIRRDATVDFENDTVACSSLSRMASSIENGTARCNVLQAGAVSDACCYDKCDLCGENSFPNWGITVEVDGVATNCGTLHYSNGFEAGTNECLDIQQDHCNACCTGGSCDAVPATDSPSSSPVNFATTVATTEGIRMRITGIGEMTPEETKVFENRTEKYIENYFGSNNNSDVFDVAINVTNQTEVITRRLGSADDGSSDRRSLETSLDVIYTQTTAYIASDPTVDIGEIIEEPFNTEQKRNSYIAVLRDQEETTVFDAIQTTSPVAASGKPATEMPSASPSQTTPSSMPSATPSSAPGRLVGSPSEMPSASPSQTPSAIPTNAPSGMPSAEPSSAPGNTTIDVPSGAPSTSPSQMPNSGGAGARGTPMADPTSGGNCGCCLWTVLGCLLLGFVVSSGSLGWEIY